MCDMVHLRYKLSPEQRDVLSLEITVLQAMNISIGKTCSASVLQ